MVGHKGTCTGRRTLYSRLLKVPALSVKDSRKGGKLPPSVHPLHHTILTTHGSDERTTQQVASHASRQSRHNPTMPTTDTSKLVPAGTFEGKQRNVTTHTTHIGHDGISDCFRYINLLKRCRTDNRDRRHTTARGQGTMDDDSTKPRIPPTVKLQHQVEYTPPRQPCTEGCCSCTGQDIPEGNRCRTS